MTCMQPTCPACSTHGTRNLCPRFACIVRCRPEQGLILLNAGQGISGRGGGLSEYVVVDQMLVHVLPPGTSCEREPRIVRSFPNHMSSGGRGYDGTSCRRMARCQESELQGGRLSPRSWCRTSWYRLRFYYCFTSDEVSRLPFSSWKF